MENDELTRYLPIVREIDFVNRYLPGLINTTDPEGRRRWLDEIAKNIYLPVHVVDNDKHDKILFTVPPYVRPTESKDIDYFQAAIREFHITATRFNDNIASKTLHHRMAGVFKAEDSTSDDKATWRMILERYGYIKPSQPTVTYDPDIEEPDW